MKARLAKTGLASPTPDGRRDRSRRGRGRSTAIAWRAIWSARPRCCRPGSDAPAGAASPWALALARAALGAWVERLASPVRADTRARTLAHAEASAAESELSAIAERLGREPARRAGGAPVDKPLA